MTKRFISVVLLLIAACMALGQEIRTTINGHPFQFRDVKPITRNGRVLVPVRGVFEQMGALVEWNPDTREVYAKGNGREIVLYIGKYVAMVNGQTTSVDVAPMVYMGRTMVPLRFISESMGADVTWNEATSTVAITTALASTGETGGAREETIKKLVIRANTVIPVTLNDTLSSKTARVGDPFTATLDIAAGPGYMGLPEGTKVEGHVDAVRAMSGTTPGVLGLAFDNLRLPNGKTVEIDGSLSGLDAKSVDNNNGRLVAKQSNKDLKYVGIGAGAGALIAIMTKNNVLTTTIIGAALGYLYDQSKLQQPRDVQLKGGTTFGVVLNRDQEIPSN